MSKETITRVFGRSPILVFFSKQRNINAVLIKPTSSLDQIYVVRFQPNGPVV
jgi:hypothetical protein